jgi:hypothetical protein
MPSFQSEFWVAVRLSYKQVLTHWETEPRSSPHCLSCNLPSWSELFVSAPSMFWINVMSVSGRLDYLKSRGFFIGRSRVSDLVLYLWLLRWTNLHWEQLCLWDILRYHASHQSKYNLYPSIKMIIIIFIIRDCSACRPEDQSPKSQFPNNWANHDVYFGGRSCPSAIITKSMQQSSEDSGNHSDV